MMRPESKGRSASPHRITYKSDFHAIKCSFDTGTRASTAHSNRPSSLSDSITSHTSTGSRGRVPSTRGTKIRENIFLQMDSQQLKQDGPVRSSGATPLDSPCPLSLQPQTSPFARPRRSFMGSSSVLSAVTNISTPDSSVQDRLSRSEEIADIDRAALAQKFSVTRRLFETKGIEGEGVMGRVSKGMVEEKEERGAVSHMVKEEEASGKKHAEEDSFNKPESMNLPIINISLPKLHVQTSMTRYSKSIAVDGPEVSPGSPSYFGTYSNSTQQAKEGPESETLDLCLTQEEPVRAELVSVKNESSESDENEEEKVRKGCKHWLKEEGERYMNCVAGERVQDLVDDVFEDPGSEIMTNTLENGVSLRAGDSGQVIPSEEPQKESSASMSCETETKGDRERGGDKYWQVNEHWEGQKKQTIELAQNSTEKVECREEKSDEAVEGSAGSTVRGMMQKEGIDKKNELLKLKSGEACRLSQEIEKSRKELQESHVHQEVKQTGQEDQTESEIVGGIGNEAPVCEQESQSCPEHSTPPRQEWESSTPTGSQPSTDYEEIPGLVEEADQEDEDGAERAKAKVRFSAPIKVRKKIKGFQPDGHLCLNSCILLELFSEVLKHVFEFI